ncbi:MAG TPA: hypothetical protein VHC00_07785 [Rhizobiaceae bacterium]|nr:hypothetical protein [Rhizobiaceae bacterium]
MANRTRRKIELYAIHAHETRTFTYDRLFEALSKIPAPQRVFDVHGYVVGFPVVAKYRGGYFIQATEGDPDAAALVFDRSTGQTRETDLRGSEVLSQATHMFVSPEERRASIEYVRRGVKAVMLGPAIEGVLSQNIQELRRLRIEFTPRTTEDFVREIQEFERIRLAAIRITKPNASWTDHYTQLSELMDDSRGEKVEIDVRAGRGESLKKNSGIVRVIKQVANDDQPYLDEAIITGTRTNETTETTIRASQHIQHTRVSVDSDEAGVPLQQSIRSALTDFLNRFI